MTRRGVVHSVRGRGPREPGARGSGTPDPPRTPGNPRPPSRDPMQQLTDTITTRARSSLRTRHYRIIPPLRSPCCIALLIGGMPSEQGDQQRCTQALTPAGVLAGLFRARIAGYNESPARDPETAAEARPHSDFRHREHGQATHVERLRRVVPEQHSGILSGHDLAAHTDGIQHDRPSAPSSSETA